MNTHAEKTYENKRQVVANSSTKLQESIAQRKLQEAINNSPHLQQLKAYQEMANNSPQVKQLKAYQSMANNFTSQTAQRKENVEEETLQGKFETVQKKENKTGLPDNLKSGIENLSGYSMDDVKVHYNSDKPAQLQAHAYAQGTDIHLASGQEKHLPHEAWHVVQQKQGKVKPTLQMKGGVNVNDDAGLENEADMMGEKAVKYNDQANLAFPSGNNTLSMKKDNYNQPIQKKSLEELVNESPLAEKAINFEESEKEEPVQLKGKKNTHDSGELKTIQRRRVNDGKVIGSISSDNYPESVQHIVDAINSGQPSRVTINRPGAKSNRRKSLKGIRTISGTDRDEYPMAVFSEGGMGASVRHIDPSDNRGSGSSIGHILRKEAPDGTVVDVEVIPKKNGETVIQL